MKLNLALSNFSFGKEKTTANDDSSPLFDRSFFDDLNAIYEKQAVPVIVYPNGVIATTVVHYTNHVNMFREIRRKLESRCEQVSVRQLSSPQFEALRSGSVLSDDAQHEGEIKDKGVEAEVEERGTFNEQATDVVRRARELNSSDIYIDITEKQTVISYRTNGLKKPDPGQLTREQGYEIARAMWSLGNQSFEESQASSASFSYQDKRFRCSSIPSVLGAGIVLRMRDPDFYLPLEVCGYSDRQIEAIRASAESPGGLIAITGETNSGKSSTLATLMADLPNTQKIIEISDPIEVIFQHITQIEINRYAQDATEKFKRTLGELVRQNPDTLILGEIRDAETADAAVSMALQGKRVLSTLHTQSCMLAFSRMGDLGVDENLLYQPGFIASVVNQNLVPTLCPACRSSTVVGLTDIQQKELQKRHDTMFDGQQRYASGVSCGEKKCVDGVVGQTLVAEVYPMVYDRDGRLIRKLSAKAKRSEIDAIVQEDWGLETKQQHAWSKIVKGEIDTYHTERIIGRLQKGYDSDYPEYKQIV